MKKQSPFTSVTGLRFAAVAALAALVVFLSGCASKDPSYQMGSRRESTPAKPSSSASTPVESRQRAGLGTGFGEERDSHVSRTDFIRANGNRPSAVDRIYYNDREGIDAMLAHEGGADRRAGGIRSMADSRISVGLKNGSGRWLDGWYANGQRFVAGERGERYEVVIRNESRDRLEIVTSIDGLDAMDGRSASFSKRGYIVYPGDTLTVDGFRTSGSTVAAFRFSRVDRSYAALKHGDTRNVGVIGLAVFEEDQPELRRRQKADAFPGTRWATPPQ